MFWREQDWEKVKDPLPLGFRVLLPVSVLGLVDYLRLIPNQVSLTCPACLTGMCLIFSPLSLIFSEFRVWLLVYSSIPQLNPVRTPSSPKNLTGHPQTLNKAGPHR